MRADPLFDESLAGDVEVNAERLEQTIDGVVKRRAQRQSESKLARPTQIELAGERYVAVGSVVVIPLHPKIGGEIGPTVIHAHVAAGAFLERNSGSQCQPCVALSRSQYEAARNFEHFAVVAPPSDLQMGSAQHIKLQAIEEGGIALQTRVG